MAFLKNIIKLILKLNLNTIRFNLYYFPWRIAIKFPVFISGKVYLKELNGKIKLDCSIRPGLIQIGYGEVGIFDKVKSRTLWEVSGCVTFNGACNIGHGSKISVGKTGFLHFGDNFTITAESTIVCFKEISFGNNCLLSWEILIMDTDFHKIKNDLGELLNSESPIIFGDNVWIGCRTTILKGTKISKGCVVGANSLINKDLHKTNSIYAGIPAKVIKENITWEF